MNVYEFLNFLLRAVYHGNASSAMHLHYVFDSQLAGKETIFINYQN